MTASTTNPRQHRRPSRLGGVAPLPASVTGIAPKPVKDASEALRKALASFHETSAAVTAARADLDAARAADEAAATSAIESGEKLSDPQEPEAQRALEEAERLAPAAEGVAAQRQTEFLDAMLAHFGEMHEAIRAELSADVIEPSLALLDQVEARMIQRRELLSLAEELGDGEGIAGRAVSFKVWQPKPNRPPLRGAGGEQLEDLRSIVRGES